MLFKQRPLQLAGAVILFALTLLVSPVALAADEGSVGGKPANPRSDNPRSASIFVYELESGESVYDEVLITNNTNDAKTVEVYATDSLISSGGAFACEQKADEVNAEGEWITLEKNSVELAANSSKNVAFTLQVPEDVSPGEHNSCIVIQAVEAPLPSSVNGLQLSFRSAIRVAVTVPGEITKTLEFVELKSQLRNSDILQVTPVLKNNGNVSLDTDLVTNVKTPFGNSIETIEGTYPILAGQTSEFNFEFQRPFWGGFYRIVSEATYDTNAQTSLGEEGGAKRTIYIDKYIFILPKPGAIIIELLLLVFVIFGIIWLRRRKNYNRLLHSGVRKHVVVKGDTITSLAAAYRVNWKDIARLNDLKAPYVLESGQVLRIPGMIKNIPKKKPPYKRPI